MCLRLQDKIGPKRAIAGSLMVLLVSIVAILTVDKHTIAFIAVEPPVTNRTPFSAAAERANLLLGCLMGAAGGPLLIGLVTAITASQKTGMAVLIPFFLLGLLLLAQVHDE